MALVSYDYSSGSGDDITDEEDDKPSRSTVIIKQNPSVDDQQAKSANTENPDPKVNSGLFSQLPQIKSSIPQITEENDLLEDFIPTVKTLKEKKKVQITIPSLSDFDEPDNEKHIQKRQKPSQKGSGLLGMLPPVQSIPKSNTMFIPNTLKKKSVPLKPATTSKAVTPASKRKSESDSDEEVPIPDTFDDQMWETVCGRSKPPKTCTVELDMTAQIEPEEYSSAPGPIKPYEGLNNEAFKELVGKSKRPIGNIKLIDINEDEIMPDKDLWMTKSLTDPDLAPRAEPKDTVDPTKKRKHHITYLAQQARVNEQELKSAWAASKNNRMMSRSKYGF